MPEFIGIHHINFSVTDIEASAGWYERVLGMNRGWQMDDVEGRGQKQIMLHPTSPFRLVLSHHQKNDGEAASEFRTGMDHIAFSVADRVALEEWRAHFEEMGVDVSPVKEGATGWLITFRDPDNIQMEMYTQSEGRHLP